MIKYINYLTESLRESCRLDLLKLIMKIDEEFKSKSTLITILIISITLLSVNFLSSEVFSQVHNYAIYSNFGFTIKYPSTWTVGENIQDTFEEVYIRSSSIDLTAPGIIIARSHDPKFSDMDFEDYFNMVISNLTYSQYSKIFPNSKLLEVNKENYFLGGERAMKFLATVNWENQEYKLLSYQTIKDGISFGIHAIAKTDQFEEYEPVFNRIIQSFRFNDPTDTDATNAIGKGSYSNFGFIIQHPLKWTVQEIVGNKTFEEFYFEHSVKDLPSPAVVISKSNDQMFSNMSLGEYTKWNLDTSTNSKRSYGFLPVEVNSDDYFVGGIKAIRSIVLANIDNIEVKDLSYQTIKDGISFGIHAIAKTDQFEEYEPVFNRIIQSFRFNDPTDSNATNAIENLNSNVTTSTNQEIQKTSDVKSLQQDFVVLVILQPLKGSIDSKSTNEEKQNNFKELPENQGIKKVSVNVVLGTHIYTLFDQEVSIKLYNSNGQFASQYLTVPDTGNVIQPFKVDETYIPEGTLFTICVTNQGNFKEDCKNVSREYGVDYIPVYMTVP